MTRAENPMGTKPVFPLLMTMSVPAMVSMLIQSLYNIVDSLFVGRLSQEALTAVSIVFPLQNLVLAVAVGLGVGVNANIARSLGEKRQEDADQAASHGLFLTFFHITGFVVLGILGSSWFVGLFTDSPEILQMGSQYSHIVICLSGASLIHILIEKIFQATGKMLAPMLFQIVGAGVNIILDPILIFGLLGFPSLGVKGAAIATIIGQCCACGLAVLFYRKKNCGVHIKVKDFHWDRQVVRKLYSVGIPSCMVMSMPSLLVGLLNGILAGVSQLAVAVFGIYFKLQTFVYMPVNGLVQGMRPIISYNFGAEHYGRMKKTLHCSLTVTATIMAVGTILFLLGAEWILLMFGGSQEMLDIGISALRIICCGFIFSTVGVIIAGAFEALGEGGRSLAVSLLRQMAIIPPLAFVLVRFTDMGLTGVWITFPIAEVTASAVALVLYRRLWKSKLKNSLPEEEGCAIINTDLKKE
ncbi:MATE family efflux transporter [Anaerovorax odorimutans]|uniref:MATE family efflux transporter n=1 Tax=Anaerovorax odorimutans TaxID=109327 RepID=A0ABT1RLL6_9FIRM|nr:MATE family efflux transporter [Anaerovorax odorimutans]MCQ4636070.1 MATE family efflux transporter [Anaerovorax odorimutans]